MSACLSAAQLTSNCQIHVTILLSPLPSEIPAGSSLEPARPHGSYRNMARAESPHRSSGNTAVAGETLRAVYWPSQPGGLEEKASVPALGSSQDLTQLSLVY